MAYMHGRHDTGVDGERRFNSELAVALAFNLGAWLVVGVIAILIAT